MLLVGAGLTLRSLASVRGTNPGFGSDNVLTGRVALPDSKYPESSARTRFFQEVQRRLSALPGVQSVGTISFLPLSGGGAGTGLSAKCAEAGGIDLIIIYNSGRFRMAGRGSLAGLLPYGDANAIVMDMAREVLPVVERTPVLAGVCGTDPFRLMRHFLRDVKAAGFSGVQNFPTVGLVDGVFRQGLEETGMGYGREVEMIGGGARRVDTDAARKGPGQPGSSRTEGSAYGVHSRA